jgi:DNA-binding NarL/FixJ family response regulator
MVRLLGMQSGHPAGLPSAHAGFGPVSAPRAPIVSVAVEEGLLRRRIVAALAADDLSVVLDDDQPGEAAPDVVILSRDLSHLERVLHLKSALHDAGPAPVVIVSPRADGPGLRRALGAGASGLVFDSEIDAALAPVVRAVAANQTCVPRETKLAVDKPALTHREREVLKLAVSGRTNNEIAAAMCLAESTVKSHLSSAFNRLGVRSRREAATLVLDPDGDIGPIVLATHTETPGLTGVGNGSLTGG